MKKLLFLLSISFLFNINACNKKVQRQNNETRFSESHFYNSIERKLNDTINLNKPNSIIKIFEDLIDYLILFHNNLEEVKKESFEFVRYYSNKFSMSPSTENLLKLFCYTAYIRRLSKIDRIAREIIESRKILSAEAQKIFSKM